MTAPSSMIIFNFSFPISIEGALKRASARPDPLAHVLEDCGIPSVSSPKKKYGKTYNTKKPRMKNFGVQCRMKSDDVEVLRARLKEEKRNHAVTKAYLSQERKKKEKFYSEENVKKVVKDWLNKRYNSKQTKFLMSKGIRVDETEANGDLEPGEQRNPSSIIAAKAAKEALAKARASLGGSTVEDDDELEPGEIRR